MRPVHRSKYALGLALGFATTCACHGGGTVTTRVVTTHVPLGCVSAGQALDGEGYAKFYGSGDFESTLPAAGHPLKNAGDVLSEIDPASRALVVDVSEGAGRWLGVTLIPAAGNLDVLLLPWMASCGLAQPIASSGATFAPIDAATVLITGGVVGGEASQVAAPSRVAHLAIDSVEPIGTDFDLLYPRTHASVTPFGDGALVAGGSAPGAGGAGAVRNTAEVYSSETGGFDQQNPILLSTGRTEHGAAVLVTGETLLVGGTDGTNVLGSMETVDPITRTVRAVNIAPLAVARREPVVLRLASGEILVAGGIDATGGPVSAVEWFSPDVSMASKLARPLVDDATARAYIALEGGGALAVFAPPVGAAPSYQSVWVIDADGTFEAATPLPGALTTPVLFGGAGGAPVLWTGDRWLRWQPWSGSFGAFISLDETPPDVGSVGTSPDPGLALWVDPSTSALTLMRFDTNGPYSPLSGPLLVTDTSDMAPDALAGSAGASFDPSLGLVLPPSRSAFVTDRTYADVDIDVDAPTGEPAVVVLRDELGDELEVGGVSCPVPRSPDASLSTHVERRGSTVSWSQSSGGMGICPSAVLPNARVSIGVRSGSAVARSVATNLRVARL
jgi:hypothetical protein